MAERMATVGRLSLKVAHEVRAALRAQFLEGRQQMAARCKHETQNASDFPAVDVALARVCESGGKELLLRRQPLEARLDAAAGREGVHERRKVPVEELRVKRKRKLGGNDCRGAQGRRFDRPFPRPQHQAAFCPRPPNSPSARVAIASPWEMQVSISSGASAAPPT